METKNNKRRSSSHKSDHELNSLPQNTDPSPSSSSRITINGNWNDLPEEILISILTLLPSVADLASAASVSYIWNAAAVAASNNESTLQHPPLILTESDGGLPPRCYLSSVESGPASKHHWHPVLSFETLANSVCVGSYFPKLILINGSFIILHDVFTGEQIRSPRIAGLRGLHINFATLTAPLHSSSLSLVLVVATASPNYYVFSWEPNGSGNRDGMFVVDMEIVSFALFKDQVYYVDWMRRVGVVELVPKVSCRLLCDGMFLENLPISYSCVSQKQKLIECDGELLIVLPILISYPLYDYEMMFEVYKLDLEKRNWIKKEKLNNWCLFIDNIGKSGFSCKNPERWGGRSNCIYVSACLGYITCPLNDEIVEIDALHTTFFSSNLKHSEWPWPSPFWVYPRIKSVEKVRNGKADLKSKKVKTEGNQHW